MNTIDGPSIKLRFIAKSFALIVLILTILMCCYEYHKYQVYNSIKVVVNDTATIEYGSANYDIKKLLKEVVGEIVSIKQNVDTSVLGEQEIILEVKKENVIREVPVVISIVDTLAPEIKIKNERVSITQGDTYNLVDNIISVTDEIDGDLPYLPDSNEESVQYYNFKYDDTESVGEHVITVNAVDSSRNISTLEFILEIEEPVVVTPVYYDLSPNASGNDIVSIAYSLVGLPYIAGGVGPNGFDCSGFVQYVYSRVGIGVSRSTSTQIYDGLPVRYEDAQPGDILVWGYVDGEPSHTAIYVGNGQMIHATNPNDGVMLSDVNWWTYGSGTHILSTRRI